MGGLTREVMLASARLQKVKLAKKHSKYDG